FLINFAITRDPSYYNWVFVYFMIFTGIAVLVVQEFVKDKMVIAVLGMLGIASVLTGEFFVMQLRKS
ncbi:hypothetical protein PMAYCL1PPCAC_21323, partial [Pristionchus mayeri]